MWLHWLHPEESNRSCEFCKKYQHYNSQNPDENKRGKPILLDGQPILRSARDKVVCDHCLVRSRWTEKNKAIYTAWRMQKFGFGEINERLAWAFFVLEETAREINTRQNASYLED